MNETKGSAALVTGGATRLGYYFARTLAEMGYDIALHYNSSMQAANEAADSIRALGVQCEIFQFDFASREDPSSLMKKVFQSFPSLEVLVNNASAYAATTTEKTDRKLLETQFSVNFFTPYLLTAAFAKMVGEDRGGSVINILDNKIAYQQFHYSAYLLSKKTLAEFTKLAALEFAPRHRINGIAPGVVLPGETRTNDYLEWRKAGIPLKRLGETSELGKALKYLLDNEFVTGQILFVDGGETINNVGRNAENYSSLSGDGQ